MSNLRFAFRQLFKSPGFTFTAALTLALGIGANTAIFSVINSVLLRPLPYPRSEQLLVAWDNNPGKSVDHSSFSPAKLADLRAQTESFQSFAGYYLDDQNLVLPNETISLSAARTTGPFFQILGVAPFLGRSFTEADDKNAAPGVVILSYALWQQRFAGDPQIVGRQIELGQKSCTVVGVMPLDFTFPRDVALWTPAAFADFIFQAPSARLSRFVTAIGRLKPNVTIAQAQAEVAAVSARIAEQHPTSDRGWKIGLVSLYTQTIGSARAALLLLLGAVGLVLLIACVNVASLQLMRAEARRREMAIRLALGAGHRQLVRQLLLESVVLALVGGFAGVLVAYWGIDLLLAASDAREFRGSAKSGSMASFFSSRFVSRPRPALFPVWRPHSKLRGPISTPLCARADCAPRVASAAIDCAVSSSWARSNSLSSSRSVPVCSLKVCFGSSTSTRVFVAKTF